MSKTPSEIAKIVFSFLTDKLRIALAFVAHTILMVGAGFSLGWIVGLSSTPLMATLLPALLTLVIGVVTALSGIDKTIERSKAALQPTALLIIGVGIGV